MTRTIGVGALVNLVAVERIGLALLVAAALPGLASAQATSPTPAPQSAANAGASHAAVDLSEVIVNGIPYKETVLPTRLSSSSVYGLDLGVMDTPRNTTLLSTTQLETLNIQDPRAFSYLTASSYTDSAFGTPNIPRIRGQYADVFYNGMRSSFNDNGYGVPPNFDSFENISITKGPASVVDGPGPGVGGAADFITKRPSLTRSLYEMSASIDSVGNRRATVDIGGPIIPDVLGVRLSFSGEDSDSYFYGHTFRKGAVYAAVRWSPNPQYQLDFNTELVRERFTENVGINRVNQNLINNDMYLQGAPDGNECFSTFYPPCGNGAAQGIPIGSPGNPYSPVAPILTEVNLTTAVPFNTRITLDQTPDTFTEAFRANAQLIESYRFNDHLTLENNFFFDYLDSENLDNYYFADNSNGSFTVENRTDLKANFDLPFGSGAIRNEIIVGATFRLAHVNYIDNYGSEPASVYDLTSNPSLWVFNSDYQILSDAFPYKGVFGAVLYGTSGRDSINNGGNTGISDLYDTGVFFQHRMEFSPQFSLLYGGRIDLVQDHTHDPLPCLAENFCSGSDLPPDHTTGVYGLGNGNVSLVYRPQPWVSSYVTFDFAQGTNPNGGEGGVNAYGQEPDHELLRKDSFLYETGLKFNLLNNKLFAGMAVFDQKRSIPSGPNGTQSLEANIRGGEIELNYQPTRNFFATASYSYIKTTIKLPTDTSGEFYNYPAQPGVNIDGAGLFAYYANGQTLNDPGVPQQIFNFLGNYKFDNGLGFRFGVQVTGPIQTTLSGQLNPVLSSFVPANVVANNYYYQSPVIPTQYTMNAAVFYEIRQYTLTFSVYNLTDRLNWQAANPFYGNDFLVRNDPRTFEARLQVKF